MSEQDPLDDLGEALVKARQQIEEKEAPRSRSTHAAMKIGIDFVSGVAVGTGLGYALDAWLGLLPLFTLVGMLLGTAAGVKLMMETANRAAADAEREQQAEEKNKR